MLNIVIPMAGLGSRFAKANYPLPKPLLDIHGLPMIQVVINNLTPKCEHRFIFICQNEHIKKFSLNDKLSSYTQNPIIIGIDGITEGQASSVLLAKEFIDTNDPLMTANSDQFVDIDINGYLQEMDQKKLDGLIMTMEADDPKWSYARLDDKNEFVIETAEKQVISSHATVGIFNFKRGRDFVRAADHMVNNNMKVNNEYYICPCYNFLIKEGQKIGTYSLGLDREAMYGLGIPSDYEFFLKHPISRTLNK